MRRFAIAGLLALGVAFALGSDAEARPGQDVTHIYFSDATFSEVVGEELVLNCYRRVNLMIFGVRTKFYEVDSASCDDSGGGGGAPPQCVVCEGAYCHVVPCGG